jgi:hypothetical protein
MKTDAFKKAQQAYDSQEHPDYWKCETPDDVYQMRINEMTLNEFTEFSAASDELLDMIYEVAHAWLRTDIPYDELIQKHEHFRELALKVARKHT